MTREGDRVQSVKFDAKQSVLIVDTGRCNAAIIALPGQRTEALAEHLETIAKALRSSIKRTPDCTLSTDKAWDSRFQLAEYSPVISFGPETNPEDIRGLSIGGDESQLQWPVSFEQLQAWGWKQDAECSWRIEGPSLCWFIIDGRRVAKGERSADGAYTWTPQCTCLDDEDSGGNRFKDWDEDCPIHGRKVTTNARDDQA